VTLFDRTTRRVDLTGAGVRLLGESRRTLAAAQDARAAVRVTSAPVTSRLAVGGVAASGGLDQLGAIARFRRQHPAAEICYMRGSSGELIDDVEAGRIDAAFVTLSRGLPAGLHATELLTEPMMLMCRFDHPLASRRQVDIADVVGEDFIAPPADSFGGVWFRDQFEPTAPSLSVRFMVNDIAAILEFVAEGLGVALLPRAAARDYPQIRAVELTGQRLHRTLGIVTQSLDRASAEARSFVASVISHAA
jgi:DNA-binding transcriptional LysR family regulator